MEKKMKKKMKMEMKAEVKMITHNKTLPKITKEEILKTNEDTWGFFFLFLSRYYEIIDNGYYANIENEFNNSQHTLMAYNILYGEVTNGGFLELIQDGYGTYIFDTLFSDIIKSWGISKMAQNINKAKTLYFDNKTYLETKRTPEQYAEMYKEFPYFNSLDNEFFQIKDSETEKIKLHILDRIGDFAIIE
ncbi:DMP19 family protein [Flavobacterium sp. LS1R49]|uniref:DMP19 family protein n=1 Tax=Flavobacterium shii TaxID=2987687 RepID=A0A9X3BYB1_9FLAO|nr:DMP19 family protein [Flavobacterium shii]MCV9928555.1 DMP19 family protein [Flavobacterium shii]